MPPYEDMAEIQQLQQSHFSIKQWSSELDASMRERFAAEHVQLEKKRERFSSSQTYLNRLANLASMAGDLEEEERHLREALEVGQDEFIGNRLVENMLALHRLRDAEALLQTKDLSKSVYANLRLAALYAIRDSIPKASELVAAALQSIRWTLVHGCLMGRWKVRSGDYDGAILSFRVAAERRPNSAALHANLCCCLCAH